MKNQKMMNRHGFSMIEAAAMVLVLSMVGMTVGPSLGQMRSRAMGAASVANLQEIGVGAAMYAGANNGRMFSYSWRAGETYVMPDGRERIHSSDVDASQRQNTEILQRWTGRWGSSEFKVVNFFGREPHRRYNHLVLMDFLNEPLESTRHIDPADGNQLVWHANPLDYAAGSSVPYANGMPDGYDSDTQWATTSSRQRWAFASSYQTVPSAWQPGYPQSRWIPTASTPHLFTSSGSNIQTTAGRNMNELLFPAYKVWMHEEFDREAAGDPYFAYDQARSAKLMFDGAVNEWASGDAYPSVIPEFGFPYSVWEQTYVPLDTFPVPLGGLGDNTLLNQRYRWTFRGLTGVDYGPGDPDGG